jgi:antitoxin (DNA-binding transcriptional repressor) of toxin-antitoxin stability system
MSKVVTVEELVAHIDEHLADVERGETLTVVRDGSTVAEIHAPEAPIRAVHVPRPGVRLGDFWPTGPRPKGLVTDALTLVNEDRDGEWEKNGVP